jgi:hypothetical protein
MLQAGYLEDWKWNATLSGTPQGGVVSPILSNIYLHRLDEFVETVLIPEYTRGERRAPNPAYRELLNEARRAYRRGDRKRVRALRRQLRLLPSTDPRDAGYRRLKYARYADDTVLGFAGPKAEAEEIKARLTTFLREDLKLEMSQDKTLITHGRTGAARFLGYEITIQHNDRKATNGKRSVNSKIALRVPKDVITAKCVPYLRRGKPAERPWLVNEHDYTIVTTYGAEHRGIVPVLPAGRGRQEAVPAAVGDGDLDAEDPGREAPLLGVEDGPQVREHHPDTRGPTQVLRGHDHRQSRKITGRAVRRCSTEAAEERGADRPRSHPHLPARQATDRASAGRHLRGLRANRGCRCAPHR